MFLFNSYAIVSVKDPVDEMLNALTETFEKEGVSVAIGASVRTDPKDSLKKLLTEADQRMYINKKQMHKENS